MSYIYIGSLPIKEFLIAIYPIGFFLILYLKTSQNSKMMVECYYTVAKLIIGLYIIYYVFLLIQGITDMPILCDNRNGIQTYMSFVIGSVLLHNEYLKRKKISKQETFLLLVACYGIIESGSATGILACVVGIVVYFFPRKISVKLELLIYIFLFINIIVMQNTKLQILQIVFKVFQKNSTFTHRTWRWIFSVAQIKKHFFIGTHALEKEASIFAQYNVELFNPHNALLYIWVFGGIITVLIFGVIMYRIAECGKSYKYVSVFVGMILITGLMESNMTPASMTFTAFIAITFGIYNCEKKKEKNNEIFYT